MNTRIEELEKHLEALTRMQLTTRREINNFKEELQQLKQEEQAEPEIDWSKVRVGTPILHGNAEHNFYCIDNKGKLVTDSGLRTIANRCTIDTRREIVWIEHDGSDLCPVDNWDIVVVRTLQVEEAMKSHYVDHAVDVKWNMIKKYRVIEKAQ